MGRGAVFNRQRLIRVKVYVAPFPAAEYTRAMLRFKISATDHGRRTESFLQNLMPSAPISYLRKILKSGNVSIDGNPSSPDTVLRLSNIAEIKETAKTLFFLNNRCWAPDILSEDENMIVFNKAPGLPVHRTAEHGGENLLDQAMGFLESRDGKMTRLYPVNRLDRGTSGIVLAAKKSSTAGLYGKLFQEGLVEKRYLAFVLGKTPAEGQVSAQLDGKDAVTSFRTLFQDDKVSLLYVYPLTGRTHQIRRHLSESGHPLVGDKRYGGANPRGYNRNALHAFMLSFRDPLSGRYRTIHAPITPEFLKNLETLACNSAYSILQSLV
jgi:RluA family pseudouridine synthase